MLETEGCALSAGEKMWNPAHLRLNCLQGSDPRAATCRGKLQFRRSKLNQEINKQMMIRNGAEKLYRATSNKKLKETVALELSFVNSNLQLLKEQLAELNSSVQIYQSNNNAAQSVPMIPLGLKETKEVAFMEPFKDFILEHYSVDSSGYEKPIKELMDVRQAVRTPTRDCSGVQLLFEYYNLLWFVDRRFFSPHRSLGIHFEWFDSLTGVPSIQKTIAFEKASVLFNIAALHTQIAAKQDRSPTGNGVEAAVDNFLRAAGMFRYIKDHFSNAPSMDLSSETLQVLTDLMLAQARECLFEKLSAGAEKLGLITCLEVAQEAMEVSEVYRELHGTMSSKNVKSYVPFSWISLMLVKSEHYKALAHYHVAVGLLEHLGELEPEAAAYLECIHSPELDSGTCIDIRVPANQEEKRQLGKAHLREALLLHEESMRLHRMCRQLRQMDSLGSTLRAVHDRCLDRYSSLDQEDDFQEVLDAPPIQSATKYQLTLTPPDFSQYPVQDLFRELGPMSVFSARNEWTAARTVHLTKKRLLESVDSSESSSSDSGEERAQSFGFSVRGDSPVMVAGVDPGSIAESAGVKEGDFIVAIGEQDAKWMGHEEVVRLIREAGHELTLKVVTPTERNCLRLKSSGHASSSSSGYSSSTLSSSSSSSTTTNGHFRSSSSTSDIALNRKDRSLRRLTWNFFRRSSHSKDRNGEDRYFSLPPNENILMR